MAMAKKKRDMCYWELLSGWGIQKSALEKGMRASFSAVGSGAGKSECAFAAPVGVVCGEFPALLYLLSLRIFGLIKPSPEQPAPVSAKT